MGQSTSAEPSPLVVFAVVRETPIGSVICEERTERLLFVKELSFTNQEAYQQTFAQFSRRTAERHQHILALQRANTKVENSFCSTFYKVVLVYEFAEHTVADDIVDRSKLSKPFVEKEVWALLCSYALAASQLARIDGFCHSAITADDVRLTQAGIVKLLPSELVGIDAKHDSNLHGSPRHLVQLVLQCLSLTLFDNDTTEFLEAELERAECSSDLKALLQFMLKPATTFVAVEDQLFRLAQEESEEQQSVTSLSNTPIHTANLLVSSLPVSVPRRNSGIGVVISHPKPNHSGIGCLPANPPTAKVTEAAISMSVTVCVSPADFEDAFWDESHSLFDPTAETAETQMPDETDSADEDEEQRPNSTHRSQLQQLTSPFYAHTLSSRAHNAHQVAKGEASQSNQSTKPCLNASLPSDRSKAEMSHLTKASLPASQSQMAIKVKQTELLSFSQLDVGVANATFGAQSSVRNGNEGNLFTDPKLLQQIAYDLEALKRRTKAPPESKQEVPTDHMNVFGGMKHEESSKQIVKAFQSKLGNVEAQSKPQNKQELRKSQATVSETKLANSPRTVQQAASNIIFDDSMAFTKKSKTSASSQLNSKTDGNKPTDKNTNVHTDSFECESKKKQALAEKNQNTLIDESAHKLTPFEPTKAANTEKPSKTQNSHMQPNSQPSSKQQPTASETEGLTFVTEAYLRGQYRGTKRASKRHGFGTFEYSEGGRYEGNWEENRMHGRGTLFYPNGCVAYDGEWREDRLDGYGVLYNETKADPRNRTVPLDYRDWSLAQGRWVRYEGSFKADGKHGDGRLFLDNGDVFEGHFVEDKVDGEGCLNRRTGSQVRGLWQANKLVRTILNPV